MIKKKCAIKIWWRPLCGPSFCSSLLCMCVCVWVKMPQALQSRFRLQSLPGCQTDPTERSYPFPLPGLSFCTKQFHHSFHLLRSSPCLNSFIISWSDQASLRLPDVCAGQQDKDPCPGSLLTGATEADLPLLYPSHGALCGGKTALIHLFHPLNSSTFCSFFCAREQNFSLCLSLDSKIEKLLRKKQEATFTFSAKPSVFMWHIDSPQLF